MANRSVKMLENSSFPERRSNPNSLHLLTLPVVLQHPALLIRVAKCTRKVALNSIELGLVQTKTAVAIIISAVDEQ